jgi:asparagine synthase (glutamine-hydrolysing)
MGDSSPDIIAARKVATMLQTEHHEIVFTAEEACQAILPVIRALEVFDVTTIRASIPMYLLAKYIREKTDTVVLFSGEGADEIGQGYVYFYQQPSAQAGHEESLRLCNDLYMFDVARADRTTAAHGLELRVPFLDHYFTHYYLSLPAEDRCPTKERCEKYALRKAFDGMGVIPDEILWRPKEAFSDGVANKKKSLFEIIREYVDSIVSDEEYEQNAGKYALNAPRSKEAYFYRREFEALYPGCEHFTPYMWLPKWCGDVVDPSARTLSIYSERHVD